MSRKFILILVLLVIGGAFNLKAQPGDPNGGNKPGSPITGIEILVGIGSLFGFKKMLANRKKRH
jgi:hypothetical protein